MRIEATSLRQLSPSLRYFVLSETLHCAIIKFGNVIVSRLKFAFMSPVNKYNNNCLVHYLPGKIALSHRNTWKIALGHRNALASSGRYLDLGQYFSVKNGPNSYYCIIINWQPLCASQYGKCGIYY